GAHAQPVRRAHRLLLLVAQGAPVVRAVRPSRGLRLGALALARALLRVGRGGGHRPPRPRRARTRPRALAPALAPVHAALLRALHERRAVPGLRPLPQRGTERRLGPHRAPSLNARAMPSWRMKGLIQRALAAFPGGVAANDPLQLTLGRRRSLEG